MIKEGDFIIDTTIIYYLEKASNSYYTDTYRTIPVASTIMCEPLKSFDGIILDSDKIIKISDISNIIHVINSDLMNKALEYLIERHRL